MSERFATMEAIKAEIMRKRKDLQQNGVVVGCMSSVMLDAAYYKLVLIT